jgi:hypothetical protein
MSDKERRREMAGHAESDLESEIERLKAADAIKEAAIRELCSIARDKNQLITELADALQKVRQSFDFIDRSTWDAYGVDDLIQSAREATK